MHNDDGAVSIVCNSSDKETHAYGGARRQLVRKKWFYGSV